jgi:hypothetical protein
MKSSCQTEDLPQLQVSYRKKKIFDDNARRFYPALG